jgi:hypothetical protein
MATAIAQTQPGTVTTSAAAVGRSRALTVALWVISVVTAGMFFMAATPKLAGDPAMVGLFAAIGVGQWFRYFTGGLEILSAVALLVPSVALYGALALAATMVGAIFTHLVIVGGSPVIPLALLAATLFIAWTRWSTR